MQIHVRVISLLVHVQRPHQYFSLLNYATVKKKKTKVFPLQARLWPRGWVEV